MKSPEKLYSEHKEAVDTNNKELYDKNPKEAEERAQKRQKKLKDILETFEIKHKRQVIDERTYVEVKHLIEVTTKKMESASDKTIDEINDNDREIYKLERLVENIENL